MGFFDSLFGKPRQIDHDFFGPVQFHGGKAPAASDYFSCQRHFAPAGVVISMGIAGNITGPTQTQVDFFKTIEENYPVITKSIIPAIEEEFGKRKEGFKVEDFTKEFEPIYLNLSRCDSHPIAWGIVYRYVPNRDYTFTVTMRDFEAKEVLFEN